MNCIKCSHRSQVTSTCTSIYDIHNRYCDIINAWLGFSDLIINRLTFILDSAVERALFLTQRRKGAEKTARFEFFESYLLLHHTSDTQLVKIHSVRKILVFSIFPQNFTFSLRYSASLRLCVKKRARSTAESRIKVRRFIIKAEKPSHAFIISQ